MGTDMSEVRTATDNMKPIYDKLNNGNTSLTQEEIDTFTSGFDTWQNYVAGR